MDKKMTDGPRAFPDAGASGLCRRANAEREAAPARVHILPPAFIEEERSILASLEQAVSEIRMDAGEPGARMPAREGVPSTPRPAPRPGLQPPGADGPAARPVPPVAASVAPRPAEPSPEPRPEPKAARPSKADEAPKTSKSAGPTARIEAAAPIAPVIEGEVGGPLIGRPAARAGKTAGAEATGAAPKESQLHAKSGQPNFRTALAHAVARVRLNLAIVFTFTIAMNVLVLAIPIYLYQISDRVLTSRSMDTLIMLTIIVVGAVFGQVLLDIFRRQILMRTAVSVEVLLGAPILSAAARSALNGSGRDYQVLGDLQHLRSFLTGGTLLAMLDAPLAPIFLLAVWLIHPQLGMIVIGAIGVLLVLAVLNKRATAKPFGEASNAAVRANLNLDALSRNSQIINALGMIPEAVRIWGRDNAASLGSQVMAQDRNVYFAGVSKAARLLTQVSMLGWGAYLSLSGELSGGMVIASSIIASRALAPVEGTIEGWRNYIQSRAAYQRISQLLLNSPLNVERLRLPSPQGRLDVERLLYVPAPSKKVVLNGISFHLKPGESLAIIGNSGAGKSTLGRMLVGSIVPTAGSVRLDLMDMKNWDPRQFGESIGYLPQDVQLFPATIKANIARMREDVTDEMIFEAAALADVHELIASFPQGYETMISVDGAPLSGGQKQRIGLARAFFGNPRLVVLDEPNSNLDSSGEAALALALQRARLKGTTVVAITQRNALLKCVDKIMIIENGAVSAIGERQQILTALGQKKAPKPAAPTAAPAAAAGPAAAAKAAAPQLKNA